MEKQHIFLKTTANFLRKRYNPAYIVGYLQGVIKATIAELTPDDIRPTR